MGETIETAETQDYSAPGGKIRCAICGEAHHITRLHLKEAHPEVSEEDYAERFPSAPLISPAAAARLKAVAAVSPPQPPASAHAEIAVTRKPLHEVFGLGNAPAARRQDGSPMMIDTFEVPAHLLPFVPEVDKNYVFHIDLLKTAMMGLFANIPIYFWGMMGTGKSTVFEQICARTGRPWFRIQHTRNTEESHIVGQYTVRDGSTVFELGPLAFAMKHGLAYLADEYDFAMPSVSALYQPVLEGKALLIKEAPEEHRIIRPHPNFRFMATGNTNGVGDETGLYQGTMIQNAANYERFGIVEEVKYLEPKVEALIVQSQSGIPLAKAEALVNLAKACREAFSAGKLGLPPSPRSLINAARVGRMRGDYEAGLRLSYVNRLSRIDQDAVAELLKRVRL
jgi:cobaltochelatase CobS